MRRAEWAKNSEVDLASVCLARQDANAAVARQDASGAGIVAEKQLDLVRIECATRIREVEIASLLEILDSKQGQRSIGPVDPNVIVAERSDPALRYMHRRSCLRADPRSLWLPNTANAPGLGAQLSAFVEEGQRLAPVVRD
jgi:hypothetical protein